MQFDTNNLSNTKILLKSPYRILTGHYHKDSVLIGDGSGATAKSFATQFIVKIDDIQTFLSKRSIESSKKIRHWAQIIYFRRSMDL